MKKLILAVCCIGLLSGCATNRLLFVSYKAYKGDNTFMGWSTVDPHGPVDESALNTITAELLKGPESFDKVIILNWCRMEK